MQRVLIKNVSEFVDKEVSLCGRVNNVRKLGAIVFVILEDRSGLIQSVWEKGIDTKMGDVIEIQGTIKSEPRASGGYEMQGKSLVVISPNDVELPYDPSVKDLNLHLTTLLDKRVLTVRHQKVQHIFKLYSALLKAYETTMRSEDFVEVKTPKIVGAPTEGGANFFKVKYFEKDAYLAQSPQFYKQIMVGALERVFEIGPVFRAEPHFTTRHINEYISFDAEMGFIDGYEDVKNMLNKVVKSMFDIVKNEASESLKFFDVKISEVPEKIPDIKLTDAKKIIKEKYNYDVPSDIDIDPEGERLICRYAKEELNSDFIFVTHYPWKDRPFYTMPADDKQDETLGFDLLFKNMEIATGGQRIHSYDELLKNMELKKVGQKGMEYYLETFKSGMPPHGGWGMGSERLVQIILGLSSIKEATLFPRDVKRVSP